MSLSLILTTLSLGMLAGQVAEAPDVLVSSRGVELVSDGRVFVFYAALNGLGFSEETQRKGPPLRAPVYHPLRVRVREAMRKLEQDGKLEEIRGFFEANPASIESYLAAILAHDLSLTKAVVELPAEAKKLAGLVPLIQKLSAEASVSKLFDELLIEQRRHATEILQQVESTFDAAAKHLQTPGLRAPPSLSVVPNPLDAYGAVRRVNLGQSQVVVVGPGLEAATEAVLQASLRASLAPSVAGAWGGAAKLKKSWEGLQGLKRISQQYRDGPSYASETLSRALAFQVLAGARGKPGSEAEEEFIDKEARFDLRWTRAMFRALDGRGSEPIEAALPKILARVSP